MKQRKSKMDPEKKAKLVRTLSFLIIGLVVVAVILMAATYFEREIIIEGIQAAKQLELDNANFEGMKP